MKSLLLVFALIFPTFVYAFDFKGVEVGAIVSPGDVTDKIGPSCRETATGYGCYGDTTIAGNDGKAYVAISKEKEVEVLDVSFNPRNYETIKAALVDKFSAPKDEKKSIVSNAMGAQFEQEKCTWINEKGDLMYLSKYSRKVTEGSLTITSKKYQDESDKKLKDSKKDI